jgi:hypothetical protein
MLYEHLEFVDALVAQWAGRSAAGSDGRWHPAHDGVVAAAEKCLMT